MSDARSGIWYRLLLYLGVAEPPEGTKRPRILPWWLVLLVSMLMFTAAVVSFASGSVVRGVLELAVGAAMMWNAWALRRKG